MDVYYQSWLVVVHGFPRFDEKRPSAQEAKNGHHGQSGRPEIGRWCYLWLVHDNQRANWYHGIMFVEYQRWKWPVRSTAITFEGWRRKNGLLGGRPIVRTDRTRMASLIMRPVSKYSK